MQRPAIWSAWQGDQLEDGAVSFDDSDLIIGWRYNATLQLKTPLAYLKRDGEFSPGWDGVQPLWDLASGD